MFRPITLTYLAGCLASVFRMFGFWLGFGLLCSSFAQAKKVSPSVIVASIEGEVSSLSMVDDFKVQMGSTSVGKKINPKTILTTGKTGKVALLFSNGTLITIKPGSRFYLRTYKQLEGIVEGSVDPGQLKEEPTQSELSGHLDYGDLVVKAPKLKKGSSMKLTSPLGVAGIRGTMFQLMAVRNSVTGDIMGGINLISGDIDFTDTGGNTVSLLSGQSIQLATSKLGAPVASMTGELVDLSSTYGPALTDGFTPPTPQAIFPNLSSSGDSSSEDSESEEKSFNEPTQQTFASSGGTNFEFIHNLATDLFFEIEEAETSSSEFSFESMALAPTIDIPTPQPEAPVAPPSVTGETLAGGDLEFFQGGHPELKLLGSNISTDPLVKIFNNGARMQVEMRAPSEGITWRKIDPWVQALDFLGNDITPGVQLTGSPKILLANANSAESEAPPPGSSVSYEVSYSIRDLRGLNTVIFRQVDVVATRPTIEIAENTVTVPLSEPSYSTFFQWINSIVVEDVRGNRLSYQPDKSLEGFYLDGSYDLDALGTSASLSVVATDWRGLKSRVGGIKISVVADDPVVSGDISFHAELSDEIISELSPPISATDEFGSQVDNIVLFNAVNKSDNSLIDLNSRVDQLMRGEVYEFIYSIKDSRGIETQKSLDFHVKVTPPTLESSDFNSSFLTAKNQSGILEYGDPKEELDGWLDKAKANDFNGNPLNVTISAEEDGLPRSLAQLKSLNPYNGSDNRKLYTISFSTEDPRWKSGSTHQSWEPYLKITNSHELYVVATPPKLELFFHEPRSLLPEINHEDKNISFLVRSKGDYKDLEAFQDDGDFAISPDPGEGKRDSRKLYYKATAYDGLGDEITDLNLVEVDGVDAVDSETLNSDSKITLSINDQPIRGSDVNGGSESEIIYTVSIVDVISPLISVIDHEDPIEGIMPEIRLLSGSLKDQVQGNSDEQYYFPDPGLVIRDNYYTEEEIRAHNNISIDNEYIFDYVYDSEKRTYESVWEFPNRDLDISVVGTYEVSYSLNDPSGNVSMNFNQPDSDVVTRQVNVVDSRAPIVKLYGSSTMYVDLQSIIDEETRYSDPGAYAIENLYVTGDGLFDWKTSDSKLKWVVSYSLCNDLENDTYEDPQRLSDGSDLIESTIQGYLNDPSSLPSEAIRFKVSYALEDKDNSANRGEANRTVELRGSPNLYPHIYFVLNHPEHREGDPLSPASTIDGKKAVLPTLVWPVEVGIDQFSTAPNALVFNDLGGGVIEEIQYSTELLFLGENNESMLPPNYSNILSDYFKYVNFWDSDPTYYIELIDKDSNSYQKYPKGDPEWRRVVIRYSSAENEIGNKSVRDLEIRLKDNTPPTIQKNTFDNRPVEVGEPFTDPGVEVYDAAGSIISLSTSFGQELDQPLNQDFNATIDELENRGFWEPGEYTIQYSAEDEFGNEADQQTLNISVQDNIPPYVAIVSHDVLKIYNSNNDLNSNNLAWENKNSSDLLVSPNDRFNEEPSSSNLRNSLSNLSDLEDYSNSEDPYIKEFDSKNFRLKSQELDSGILEKLKEDPQSLVLETSEQVTLADDYGRTFMWYSPFELKFKNSENEISSLQDPGFLIYEPSNSELLITSTIETKFHGTNQNQIKSISVKIAVVQSENPALSTVSTTREYHFLDDVKPVLDINPPTNATTTFVKVEAGFDYDDESADNSKFYILENGIVRDEDGEFLEVSAYDLSDGDVSVNITRRVEDLNGSGVTSVETGYDYVNHIFKIEYNATDNADPSNYADPVYRYLKIVDSTAPLIYPQADATLSDNFEIDYLGDAPDSNETSEVEDYLLQGLVASDYGYKGAGEFDDETNEIVVIDPNLDQSANRDKWEVTITKPDGSPFEPGKVFPFAKDGEPYDVKITVTDEFGNTSLPRMRKLKVGDYTKPTITLIGSSEIHDFLRFSTNTGLNGNHTGPKNEELLFADQSDSEVFDSTGFSGGAHRILLADYNFVDPGAYAEDGNSYFSTKDGYKDLDGDGIGETYAIRRVDDRRHMTACDDGKGDPDKYIGVIFAYSVLEKVENPTLYFQNLMANDTFGLDTTNLTDVNGTFPPEGPNSTLALSSVKVPNVEGEGYTFDSNKTQRINLDVTKITIEYRVRDGWDNFSDITERVVYIYESRQFPNFAFYATPLTQGDGTEFEHYYDDGTGRPFLNDTRKDTDRDGVSDYWEKVFGSDPLDKDDVPKNENGDSLDLSDPALYTGNSINFNPANP
jgi:hypothetical protein